MASFPLAAEPHPRRSSSHIQPAPIQTALSFEPRLIRIAVPPHNPKLAARLKPAALHILALLEDGEAHAWHELMAVGGARYSARVGELRAAGYVLLGPMSWRRTDGEQELRREPLGPGDVERYRMVA